MISELLNLLKQLLLPYKIDVSYRRHRPNKGNNRKEYVVVTQQNDDIIAFACDTVVRSVSFLVRYYILTEELDSEVGILLSGSRVDEIIKKCAENNFFCSEGAAEEGDIDDNGYTAFVMTFEKARLTDA